MRALGTRLCWIAPLALLALLLLRPAMAQAAPPAQLGKPTPGAGDYPDSLFVGRYDTGEFRVEFALLRFILELSEEGALRLEFADEAHTAAYATGRWLNEGDGSIRLLLDQEFDERGRLLKSHTPPIDFGHFDRSETGALVDREPLPDGGQRIFSVAQEEDIREEEGAESGPAPEWSDVVGLYGGGVLTGMGPVVTLVVLLAEDGTMHASLGTITGESAMRQLRGVWMLEGWTVTISPTVELSWPEGVRTESPYTGGRPEIFTYVEGTLVDAETELAPLPLLDPTGSLTDPETPGPGTSPAPRPTPPLRPTPMPPAVEGPQTFMVGREQLLAGTEIVLVLQSDGGAALSTQLGPDEAELVELGTWVEEGETLTVRLTRDVTGASYAQPQVLVFERTDARTLTAIDYDAERYGPDLVLYSTVDY